MIQSDPNLPTQMVFHINRKSNAILITMLTGRLERMSKKTTALKSSSHENHVKYTRECDDREVGDLCLELKKNYLHTFLLCVLGLT